MIQKVFTIWEDFFWGRAAKKVEKNAEFLSVEESEAFLKSILNSPNEACPRAEEEQ